MNKQVEAFTYRDTFLNVMALYSVLKGTPQQGVRRAELNQAGEVKPEMVDFMMDVEIKSRRILTPFRYRQLLALALEDKYDQMPIDLQNDLGQLFLRSNLNYDGDYRVLYFQAKNEHLSNAVEREYLSFPEED